MAPETKEATAEVPKWDISLLTHTDWWRWVQQRSGGQGGKEEMWMGGK